MPSTPSAPLVDACYLMPILPGKAEAARAFFRELATREEFPRLAASLDMPKEVVWIATDPEGREFVVVYLQCPDPNQMTQGFADIKHDFAMWEKRSMAEITGRDMENDIEHEFVPAELIFDWTSEGT